MQRVITQNVDGLHAAAGNTGVIEFHGSLMDCTCRRCGAPGGACRPLLASTQLPPRCTGCGGPLKPSAVLFGESIPRHAADEAMAARQSPTTVPALSSLELRHRSFGPAV